MEGASILLRIGSRFPFQVYIAFDLLHSEWGRPLTLWQMHHVQENEKAHLQKLCALNLKQINNWFINERKRHWSSEGKCMHPNTKLYDTDSTSEEKKDDRSDSWIFYWHDTNIRTCVQHSMHVQLLLWFIGSSFWECNIKICKERRVNWFAQQGYCWVLEQ